MKKIISLALTLALTAMTGCAMAVPDIAITPATPEAKAEAKTETEAKSQNEENLPTGEETEGAVLSQDRLESIASIKKISDFDNLNLYSMEICYDYDLDNLILPAGCHDENEYSKRATNEALPGFDIEFETPDFGCSAFTLTAADGKTYMGRNYDFKFDTSAMQVYCHPKDGYASVSYCAMDNFNVEDPFVSEEAAASCLMSPFMCLDGMNEKGVAIATLTLPCAPTVQDTGKPVITTASIIRLVLDRAASTEEAIELISQYDMLAICGRDYHFYISDSTGDGRVVEYDLNDDARPMVVTPISSITNYFGMYEDRVIAGQSNGKLGTGKDRKEKIESEIARAGDNSCKQTAWAALKLASTAPNPESIISNTQWSVVYNLTDKSHEFALHRRWAHPYSFDNLVEPVTPDNELPADRQATLDTIEKLSDYDDYNVYSMDILYDYSLKNMTPSGETNTQELMELILAEAAPGYEFDLTAPDFGCSVFSIPTDDGSVLMGRNYDFKYDSSCMMVHCKPWDGYESVAHAALDGVGADDPDSSELAKVACLTAPFICIDGINEKGVGIAVLTEDSEPVAQHTDKPVLGTTLLVRLVLDKAASTEEAVNLLDSYDMYAISGRDYHFFVTDKNNDSRVIEFDPDSELRETVVTPARSATNFYAMYQDKIQPNQKNGHYGHGLERYLAMEEIFDANDGVGNKKIAWEAIKVASQEPNPDSITSNTQWSIVYDLKNLDYELVPRRHWDDVYYNDVLKKN